MDLSGPWSAASPSLELERAGADPDLDDRSWPSVEVPGHWGESAAFADETGPILFRRKFSAEPVEPGRRAWLRFNGIMSDAEVWLDGHHLGDVGVYFATHRFDVTEQLVRPGELPGGLHVLAVEVSCPDDDGPKRSVTGSLQSGPLAPPGSPGGIWRSVAIETTGPVAILRSRLLCVRADADQAELQFRIVIDAAEAGQVRIDTSIVGPDGSTAGGAAIHDVASGENHLEWTAVIDEPALWWPASMGPQPRYDVGVAVRTASNAGPDDRAPHDSAPDDPSAGDARDPGEAGPADDPESWSYEL
ncbi:MAG: hypothetical protein OEV40_30275, partial [Acidimicrobiia bacterium]|nr:hypothetical protein [Acidimicrobiia bacterium]